MANGIKQLAAIMKLFLCGPVGTSIVTKKSGGRSVIAKETGTKRSIVTKRAVSSKKGNLPDHTVTDTGRTERTPAKN